MTYNHTVIVNGVVYKAGEEVKSSSPVKKVKEIDNQETLEKVVIEDKPKRKKTTPKKAETEE